MTLRKAEGSRVLSGLASAAGADSLSWGRSGLGESVVRMQIPDLTPDLLQQKL